MEKFKSKDFKRIEQPQVVPESRQNTSNDSVLINHMDKEGNFHYKKRQEHFEKLKA
jgi:hypothetical protein